MAITDELRSEMETARGEMAAAIDGAAGGWERSPGGEEWSPRQIAEHAIRAEVSFALYAASATGQPGDDGPREELSLPAGADARAALERAVGISAPIWANVVDDQLALPAPPMDDVEVAMRLAVSHLRDHAAQMRAG
jgi:hypothetical protein